MEKLNKEKYQQISEQLRFKLVNAQYDLKHAGTSVVLLLSGNDLPGCEEFIDVFQEWVDVRYVDTRAFRWPRDEELHRPPMWRYWRALPRNGRMAIFYGAWIMNLVLERSAKTISRKEFQHRLRRLNQLEDLLVDDGKIVLKVWLHTSHKKLKKRLEKVNKKPATQLYVNQFDHHIYEIYRRPSAAVELLNSSLREELPWQWVDGDDRKSRNITIAQRLLAAIEAHLEQRPELHSAKKAEVAPPKDDYLAAVDLQAMYSYTDYKTRLRDAQLRMRALLQQCHQHGITTIMAFEGWDAAGKGGVIRRITRAISAWSYRVVPVAAPTKEELDYHYLWRFWQKIPRAGGTVIFDRTWYGRVLVERVEGYASQNEWRRAYDEINDFEAQLAEANCCILKFWLHIDADEQLRRFGEREKTQYKKYKITEEDYRNREKWPQYVEAVNTMVERTSTEYAPWHLVPSNNKRYARVNVIETICRRLEAALARHNNAKQPGVEYQYEHF